MTVVGYVHTSYGARAISTVEADVDAWYSLYPTVNGIFVDEVASDPATAASYYTPLFQYVKGKSASVLVILNPGTIPDQAYMRAADIVVTFEDTYENYTNGSYPPNPAWISTYSRWRFWHLVLSAATVADLHNAISLARERNVGYVYVTDQDATTAYQQLATYWAAELTAASVP